MSKKPSSAGTTGRKRKQDVAAEAVKEAVVVESQPDSEPAVSAYASTKGKKVVEQKVVVETAVVADAPKSEKEPQQKHASQVAVSGPVPSFNTQDVPAPLQGMYIRISKELQSKLKMQAEEEGIAIHEYIAELLAESVVLRAWEIVERKAQMRGGSPNHQHQHNGGNPNHRGGNGGNNGGRRNDRFNNSNNNNNNRRMSSNRYQSIMDDKASFLEYVRSQERQGR